MSLTGEWTGTVRVGPADGGAAVDVRLSVRELVGRPGGGALGPALELARSIRASLPPAAPDAGGGGQGGPEPQCLMALVGPSSTAELVAFALQVGGRRKEAVG